jgi:hypothetical protein
MESETPILVRLDGENYNQHWVLDQPEMVLGRDDGNDIVIPNRRISRHHVAFRRKAIDRYEIEDLGSKNGTWVNGLRLEGVRQLSDGDEVHVALIVRLRFVGSGITAPMTRDLPEVIPSAHLGGRIRIDLESRRVFVQDNEIDPPLSLPQYRLLELLYLNLGRICDRNAVVEAVWPDADGAGVSEQAVDALVRRLRDRLDEIDPDWQYIITVRGHGFRLENPNLEEA